MRIPAFWLVILALSFAEAGAAAPESMSGFAPRQKLGDDPRWAASDWDDRDWEQGNNVQTRAGICWLRFTVRLAAAGSDAVAPDQFAGDCVVPFDLSSTPVNSIFIAVPFSYELYWDGRLIGRSGIVGANRAAEVVGPLDNLVLIPEALRQPGDHVLAFRFSSFHYNFPADRIGFPFLLGDLAQFLRSDTHRPIFPIAGMGGSLFVALITAVLFWFVDRRRPLLLCSALSFALAVFYLLIAWRWLHNDPYDWFYPRLFAITWVMTIIAVLFPWLLFEQFAVPCSRGWLGLILPLVAAAWTTSEIYEIKALWLCRVMLAVSLGIAAWAVWRRRPGARFVLIGILVGLLTVRTTRRDFLDPWFFVTFDVLVLFVFATLGAQLRASRQRAREAMLTAARLEIELLKKNIQPHFLLNTLATIMEVIEQDPRVAVTLIEALAGEFRILAGVSDKKLIPLAQEIELCRAHLRIMTLRKGAACSLDVAVSDEGARVPPALFHTLVENGLTHLRPTTDEQKFELHAEHANGVTRYIFSAYGEAMEARQARREGTGLRYIKARLEESYAGRWTMHGGPVPGGWRTIIEIGDDGVDAPVPVFVARGLPA